MRLSNSSYVTSNTHDTSTSSTGTPTSGTGQEYSSGVLGDTLYLKDYLLVNEVYGNLISNNVKTDTADDYWLASRNYYWHHGGNGILSKVFAVRYITSSGTISSHGITMFSADQSDLYGGYGEHHNYTVSSSLRPIITIKSNIKILDGNGTKNNPYILTR